MKLYQRPTFSKIHNLPTEKLRKESPPAGQLASRWAIAIVWLLVMAMSLKGMPDHIFLIIGLIVADISFSLGMVYLFRRV